MDGARSLWRRVVWSRGLLALFLLDLAWTASLFVAPLTLPPGSFAYTTGGANVVDHWDLYALPRFNGYAKVVYVVGDVLCHQLWYRSLWLNGNQMPICSREVSLYLFGLFGLFWAMIARPARTAGEGIVNGFPPRVRAWAKLFGVSRFAALVVVLGLLPVAVDGTVQLFHVWTGYESTNLTRVLTGVPGGLVVGLMLGAMAKSLKQFRVEAEAARVPAPSPGKA